MTTSAERRRALRAVLLEALDKTWQENDKRGLLDDPVQRVGVLRGGCEAYLRGDFDSMTDAVSLGLAFLSLAREALILNGLDLVVREEPTEPAS